MPFFWETLDQRLVAPKMAELADAMHKRIANAGTGNLSRLLDFHEQLMDEWAAKAHDAHCDAWKQQGNNPSAPFVRAVRDRVIIPMIAARRSAVISNEQLRAQRTKKPPNTAALSEWSRRCERLAARWKNRLEAEAVAFEYGAAARQQTALQTVTSVGGQRSDPKESASQKGRMELGATIQVLYDELQHLRTYGMGRRKTEKELRSKFPDFQLWKEIESSDLRKSKRKGFFESRLDSYSQERLMAFIGEIIGLEGKTAYDIWKEYRKHAGIQRKRAASKSATTSLSKSDSKTTFKTRA